MKVEFLPGIPNRPEFGEMFGGWFTEYDGQTFMVDCGVGTGAESLAARLAERLGGRGLDYVLMTHIHMDHAGGLGEITKRWPGVKIVVHELGIKHLIRPERLWESTQKVMGELAALYGRPTPISPAALIPHNEANLPYLRIFETPGHAAHHLSFRLGEAMFVGEAGGCPYLLNGRLYNRPATPPRYFPAETFASIDILMGEKDREAYFAHTHGPVPYRECFEICKKQLIFWEDFLKSPAGAVKEGESRMQYLTRMTGDLFNADPSLGPLASLPPVDLWRETYFMRNSVEGFVRYLEEAGNAKGEAL